MYFKQLCLFTPVVLCIAVPNAGASIQTYATRGLFDAAVGGQTLIDFEAQGPTLSTGNIFAGANLTIGPVSFTQAQSRLFVFGEDYYATNGLTSSYLNHNNLGTENLIINFSGSGVHSLGMDIGQLYPWAGPVGSLTLNLSTGEAITVTGLQQLSSQRTPLLFLGFTSTVAITSINISDPSKSTAIDNFAYSLEAPVVPEPTTFIVWSLLGMVGTYKWRRKSNV